MMGEGGGGQFDRSQLQRDRQQRIAKKRQAQGDTKKTQPNIPQEATQQAPSAPKTSTPQGLKKTTIQAVAAGVVALSGVKAADAVLGTTPSHSQASDEHGQGFVKTEETFHPSIAGPKSLDIVTTLPSEHVAATLKIEKQIKLLKYDINGNVTPHYERILSIARKHKDLITNVAQEKGIPPEVALSLVTVENGGGEFEVNKASLAKGMWQLKKDTAEDMGLTVSNDPKEINQAKDERLDPVKATHAALGHLRNQIDFFEDYRWGVASYHTGATNIADFVYQWAKEHNRNQTLPTVDVENGVTGDQLKTFARFIRMNHLSPHQVLSDPVIVEYVRNSSYLDDDSLAYVYAVAGARKLLEEDKVFEEVSVVEPKRD